MSTRSKKHSRKPSHQKAPLRPRKPLRLCVGDKVFLWLEKEIKEEIKEEHKEIKEDDENGNFFPQMKIVSSQNVTRKGQKKYEKKYLEGYIRFIGPVERKGKGFIDLYGIEVGEDEGESDGVFYGRQYFYPQQRKSAILVQKRQILKILKPINGQRLILGEKIQIKGRCNGIIKFIGPTHFAPHLWYGIELEEKKGKNNGMVHGIRYFESQYLHGIFIREEQIIQLDQLGRPKHLIAKYRKKSIEEMSKDLYEACAKGDIKTVHSILSIDKNVARKARDSKTDSTCLMTACYNGYENIVNELLNSRKIDVNETNYHGLTALHLTAQAGHDNIIDLLLKYQCEVDVRTEDGITPLYIAVEHQRFGVVEKLLNAFADVNIASRDNESPLIQACHKGNHDIVSLLLKAANVNINQKRQSDGATALFVACREGSSKCVEHLLSNIQIRVNDSKTNGRSPLFIASFFGHIEIVNMLLKHSEKMKQRGLQHGVIDVNQSDSKGFTPLFVAAQNGHDEIVTLLLKSGADVNQAEQRGHTPLWIAALRGHVNVVRILLAHPNIDIDYKDLSGVTALWAACQNNNADVVELLLHPRTIQTEIIKIGHKKVLSLSNSQHLFFDTNQLLSNINTTINEDKDHDENNPNPNNEDINRSRRGHHSKQLSSGNGINKDRKGADPNLAKHDGCTPLWIAASRGNSECMRALVNYGADLNKPDKSQGATPLFVACQNGKKQSVDLLLSNGADVNRPRQGDGTSPLMMSSHNGHADIVDVLLKSGGDPMQANATGLNALGCASMQGHHKIVKLIYEHLKRMQDSKTIREFVNAGDQVNGWTPLHLACMGGHMSVIKYLIYHVKVDIFKKDYENKSGLEHAWQNGHQNIVSWLSALEQQHSSSRD